MQPNKKTFSFNDEEKSNEQNEQFLTKKCITAEVEMSNLLIDHQLDQLADIIANSLLRELLNEENE